MKSIYRKDITIKKTEKWLTGKGWGRGDIVDIHIFSVHLSVDA